MAVQAASRGILSDELREKRQEIIELLTRAYWMEIETVMSYVANSINPDGVRAQEVREAITFHPVMSVGEVLELALEPSQDRALQAV